MTAARYDLAITGGEVVLPDGSLTRLDIGVSGGKIAVLAAGPLEADETIDASGKVVMPGIIDQHFHVFWGYGWETYENATRAAAKGGVTTVIDMPLDNPPTLSAERLREKLDTIKDACHIDYATFGGYDVGNPDAMEEMAEAGAGAFKLFTGGVAPPGMYPGVNDGQMLDAFRRAAALGITVTVHAENAEIVDFETERLQSSGRTDMAAWDEARPWFGELAAAHTVALLAQVTGARVVLAHASSPQTVETFAQFREQGVDVWTETGHHYLSSTNEDAQKNGMLKWNPPSRVASEVAKMWQQVREGKIQAVGSDHAPLPKSPDADVWTQLPGPGNNVETMLPVFATDAIHEHGMSFGDVADRLSAGPAKIFGLYPRKGAIQVGSDADFVVVDPDRAETLDARNLEYLDQEPWSPFDGKTIRVHPVSTVLRGKVIFHEGKVTGTPGDGQHIVPERKPAG